MRPTTELLTLQVEEMDRRLAILEQALLQARLENSELTGYLSRAFDALDEIEGRLRSVATKADLMQLSQRLQRTEGRHRETRELAVASTRLSIALSSALAAAEDQIDTKLHGVFATAEELTARIRDLDCRLGETATTEAIAHLSSEVDEQVRELRDHALEAHGLAEKARDRADFASDGVFGLQADVELDLERLRTELSNAATVGDVESIRADASRTGERVELLASSIPAPDDLRAEFRAAASRELRLQGDQIAALRASVEADEPESSSAGRKRWQQWIDDPDDGGGG